MERYLKHFILEDLHRKIILVTGPRQVGKTTLAKTLAENFDYLNYDNTDHRLSLLDKTGTAPGTWSFLMSSTN